MSNYLDPRTLFHSESCLLVLFSLLLVCLALVFVTLGMLIDSNIIRHSSTTARMFSVMVFVLRICEGKLEKLTYKITRGQLASYHSCRTSQMTLSYTCVLILKAEETDKML